MEEPIRLIMADSYLVLIEGLRHLLKDQDDLHLVEATNRHDELLPLLQDHKPDVLLLDLALSSQLTLAFVADLCQQHSETSVLAVTDSCDELCVHDLINAGVKGCLVKDDLPARWFRAIRRAGRGEAAFSPPIVEKLIQESQTEVALDTAVKLTKRQRQVLQLMTHGLNNKEIAAALGIAERTVKHHVGNIYQRLGVSGRVEAITWAWQQGLVDKT